MKRTLNAIISIGVLGLLLWWADPRSVLGHLWEASILWLVASGLSLTALTFLMAKRWQIVARAVEIDISYPLAVAEYYIAQLVNLVLPGGIAGDVARAVRVRQVGDLTRAAQSVAADRIVGQTVMFVVLGLALAFGLILPGGIAWPAIAWAAIVAGIAVAFIAYWTARADHATGRFLRMVFQLMKNVQLISLALLITGLLIFSLYACARATGTVIPPNGWFTLVPLILSAMLVPLSIGGWGWREGAAAALFPLIGAAPSAGIAMGIAYGAMMMIAALPGLYFLIHSTAPIARSAQESSDAR